MDQQKTGALIRRLRLEKGLTQRALAEAVGVGDKAVSKWERARAARRWAPWGRWQRRWAPVWTGSYPAALTPTIPREEI